MTDDRYHIDFFYKQEMSNEGITISHFMRAMDEGGKAKWQELMGEEKVELTKTAQTAFVSNPKREAMTGGTSSTKYCFMVSYYNPEGELNEGLWWNTKGPNNKRDPIINMRKQKNIIKGSDGS